jgi:hypothetical protein
MSFVSNLVLLVYALFELYLQYSAIHNFTTLYIIQICRRLQNVRFYFFDIYNERFASKFAYFLDDLKLYVLLRTRTIQIFVTKLIQNVIEKVKEMWGFSTFL